MALFVESAQNGVLVDALIFAFPASMFPSTLDRAFQPIIEGLDYSAAGAQLVQLYLAPVGVLAPESQIMIINDTVQWASRGCRRVPRVVATGVPWELRATRSAAVNSFFRFWWTPGT